MKNEETQGSQKTGDLFSSIGALVGMVAGGGNPLAAALGSGLGSLMSGGSMQDAFKSGIGSFMTGSTLGKAGLAMDMLGGGSSRERGQSMMDMLSTQKGKEKMAQQAAISAISGRSPTQALGNVLSGIGVTDATGKMDPLMGGIMLELLSQQKRPRFENLMSKQELEQYRTGERRPDYKGNLLPGTPRGIQAVQRRAMGGYIEGPGTGKSDSIPAAIYQNGGRVQEARLSDGEFVMTADAVKGAGGGNRNAGAAKMYQMMNQFERMA